MVQRLVLKSDGTVVGVGQFLSRGACPVNHTYDAVVSQTIQWLGKDWCHRKGPTPLPPCPFTLFRPLGRLACLSRSKIGQENVLQPQRNLGGTHRVKQHPPPAKA